MPSAAEEALADAWDWSTDWDSPGEAIGDALAAAIEFAVEQVIPIIEAILPALVQGVIAAIGSIRDAFDGYEADFIMALTIAGMAFGMFVLARGILSRGTLVGRAPGPVSIPVVGAVPS